MILLHYPITCNPRWLQTGFHCQIFNRPWVIDSDSISISFLAVHPTEMPTFTKEKEAQENKQNILPGHGTH
jgi:hypothetical protein